jgi:hypothetical protein
MLLPYAMYNGSTDQKVTSLIADRNASSYTKIKRKFLDCLKKRASYPDNQWCRRRKYIK